MSWADFLQYLSDPNGIAVAVGLVLSWIVEYWPAFDQLEPRWKRLAFFALCLAVPVLAAGLGVATAGWPAGWEATWWPAIVAGALAFGAGTMAHVRRLIKPVHR